MLRRHLTLIIAFSTLLLAAGVMAQPGGAAQWRSSADTAQLQTHKLADRLAVAAREGPTTGTRSASRSSASETITLTTPSSFTMVGISCRAPQAEGDVAFHLRTSLDGEHWSRWYEGPLEVVNDEDGAPQAFMDAMWTGPARFVQVSAFAESAQAPSALADVRLTAIATEEGVERATLAAASSAAPTRTASRAQPAIVTRAGWRADESLRSKTPPEKAAVKMAFVHHTASSNLYTAEQSIGIVQGVYAYHTKSLGWRDIGYNFLIDRFGTIYEGRYGGIDQGVIGAQVYGFNTGSTGISVIGTYSDKAPPEAAIASLQKLLAWKLGLHGLNPQGKATMTFGGSKNDKFTVGQVVALPVISGHRDANYTACPGEALYAQLPGIRAKVASLIGEAPTPTPTPAVPWRVTLSPPAARVAPGSTVVLKGAVKSSTGMPASGSVTLQRRPAAGGAWVNLRTAKLAANGSYAIALRLTATADWQFRIQMAGNSVNLTGYSAVQGLRAGPAVPWRVTLSPPAARVAPGSTVVLKGAVKSSTGMPASGSVTLQRRPAAGGAWVNLRTAKLAANGSYAIALRLTATADWQFRIQMAGNSVNLTGYSAVQGLRAGPAVPWRVTLSPPAARVAPGSTVVLKGAVKSSTGMPASGSVTLQRRPAAGGAWVNLRTAKLAANGSYAIALRLTATADWQFRIQMAGNSVNLTGYSAVQGLRAGPAVPWRVTLSPPAARVAPGSTVVLKGAVKSSTGMPASGSVTLQRRPAAGGAWVNLRTAKLAANGSYAIALRLTATADWQFRIQMAGNSVNLTGYSAVQGLRAGPAVPWRVTLSPPAARVAPGSTVVLKGAVKSSTGMPASGSVTLQRRPAAGGAWVNLRTAKLAANGSYAIALRLTATADWQFRIQMAGNSVNLTGYSAVQGLMVH